MHCIRGPRRCWVSPIRLGGISGLGGVPILRPARPWGASAVPVNLGAGGRSHAYGVFVAWVVVLM